MSESPVGYRVAQCECGSAPTSAVHLYWCSDGPSGALRNGPRASLWRGDRAFIEQAFRHFESEVIAATSGKYDAGAGQKLTNIYKGWLLRAGALNHIPF